MSEIAKILRALIICGCILMGIGMLCIFAFLMTIILI